MIDEKKLIEDLQNYCRKQPYLVSENIWEIINSQPQIGGWIPCSERLPETYEDGTVHKVDPECITFTDRDCKD